MPTCQICGKALVGKQTKFCSRKCGLKAFTPEHKHRARLNKVARAYRAGKLPPWMLE